MNIEGLRASPVGELIPIQGFDARWNRRYEHWAFSPAMLPEQIRLSVETQFQMSEADRFLGNLNARIKFLPNPRLLVRAALRSEAKSTSAIEGTYATLDEILKAEYVDNDYQSGNIQEILNYVRAATRGLGLIETLPISKRVLEELHGILIRGTRGDGFDAGRLRQKQVFVGEEGAPVEAARFIPVPNGSLLEAGFSDWEKWVNADHMVPLLAKVALAHYQFETLHPFSDGNGRLGRLIITLQLVAARELEYPILNLSAWLEPRKDEYIDALMSGSLTGDYDSWIQFFCRGIASRAQATLRTIDSLFAYRDGIVTRASLANERSISVEIADFVIGNPVFTIEELRQALGVATNTAASRVRALERLNVVREVTGASYGRVFFAPQVSALLDEPR